MSINKFGGGFTNRTGKDLEDRLNSKIIGLTTTMLPRSGGSMTGILDMTDNFIDHVRVPLYNHQAASKEYVDELCSMEIENLEHKIESKISTGSSQRYAENSIGLIPHLKHNTNNKSGFLINVTKQVINSDNIFTTVPCTGECSQAHKMFHQDYNIEWNFKMDNKTLYEVVISCPRDVILHSIALRGKSSPNSDNIFSWHFYGKKEDGTYVLLVNGMNLAISGDGVTFFRITNREAFPAFRFTVLAATGPSPGISYMQLFTLEKIVS